MEIIPAILTNSPEEANALLNLCDSVAPRTQIDIIDGEFADNKTIYPESFRDELFLTKLDFHLMVKEPIHWIKQCVGANADRIIGQIELMSDQYQFVNDVVAAGAGVGLAIDLATEVEEIDDEVLPLVDVILVMSVKAGFGGQDFDPIAIQKIKKLCEIRSQNDYHYKICDDGGVSLSAIKELSSEDVDEVAIGKRIFEGNLEENFELFKKASIR